MDNVDVILQLLFIGIAVASVLLQTCRYSKAIELFCECFVFLKKHSSKLQKEKLNQLHALVCYRLFALYCVVGDYDNAILSGEKTLLAFYENDDSGRAAALLDEMADVFLSIGEREKPTKRFEETLHSLNEASKFQWGRDFKENIAKTFLKLGDYSMSCFEYASAKGHFEKAFSMWKETGNKKEEGITLIRLAYLHEETEEYQQAKEHCEKAIVVFEEAGEIHQLGGAWGWLGKMCNILGEFDKAKTLHKKALDIAVKMEDKIGQIKMYRHLANVHVNLSEQDDAMKCYQQSLALSKEIGDRKEEASTYSCLGGTFYRSLNDFENAENYCKKARKIYREIGDMLHEGIETYELGQLYHFLGKCDEAGKCHERAVAINKQIGNRIGEGGAYCSFGVVYICLGDHDKAKECYEKALAIFKEANHLRGQGTAYGHLGTVCHQLCDYASAYGYYKRSLEVDIRIGNKEGLPASYGNIGLIYMELGEYTKACKCFEKALTIAQKIGHRKMEANILANMANLWNKVSESNKAKEYYEQALQISKETGDIKGEAHISCSLGNVYISLGEISTAKNYLEKSLDIMKRIRCKDGEGAALGELGYLHVTLGEYAKARTFYEQALDSSRQTGDKKREMSMNNAIGGLQVYENNSEGAFKYFKEALSIAEMIGTEKGKNTAYCNMAVTHMVLCQDIPKALLYLSRSIKGLEEMRESVGKSEYHKIGFDDKNFDCYQLMVGMLLSVECIDLALSILELARARLLTELMATQYSCQQPGFLRNLWTDFARVIQRKSCVCLSFLFLQDHLFCWIIKAGRVKVVIKNGLTADIRPQGTSVQDWLESLANETCRKFLLLQDEGCEDRSLFLWDENSEARSPSKIEEGSPASQATKPNFKEEEVGEDKKPMALTDLYKLIITPVQTFLAGTEIIIVPDRCLHIVPFAALINESGEYLSEKFRIRYIPSLTTLKLIQDSKADYHSQMGVLIVGDPDVGLTGLDPLPCAREEAEMIGRLLRVRPLTGKQATKQTVLQKIHSVSLIHIAAHGNADRGDIALAPAQNIEGEPRKGDFVLTMSDISKVQLQAKLVVLSCCHSARGQIKAEGVVGIARAFLGSGARSVLVSLWAVDDIATMQFMKQFYGHLVRGKSASQSLHETMKWMRGNPEYSQVRKWAPFMLIGDDVSFEFKN